MSGETGSDRPHIEFSGFAQRDAFAAQNIHLHQHTVRPPVRPRELPPGPRLFLDRAGERGRLLAPPPPDAGRAGPRLVVVTGLGGIGKTALLAHLGEALHARHPDGTLYADLGHDRRVDVADVLGGFLHSLGLADDEIPARLPARRTSFSSLTAGRRLLVVLDNAASAVTVEQLLPASAGSTVIVTSTRRLSELDADETIPLASLPRTEAVAVLGHYCAAAAGEPHSPALAELADLCEGHPAALGIIGAQLRKHARRPQAVTAVRVRAALDRPAVARGERSVVDAVAAASYEDLPAPAASLYRRLADHPGAVFDAADAAALTGGDPDDAADLLDELYDANLITPAPGGHRFTSLVRDHARREADRSEPPARRRESLLRLVVSRLHRAQFADRATGRRLRFSEDPPGEQPFGDRRTALDWLETERETLLALQRAAADHGRPDLVVRFAEAKWPMHMARRTAADWRDTSVMALDAATALGEPRWRARMSSQYGRWHLEYGDPAEAETLMREAIDVADTTDALLLQASTREFLGRVLSRRGEYGAALEANAIALGRLERMPAPDPRARALLHQFNGQARLGLGDARAATADFTAALSLFTEVGDTVSRGKVLTDLGRAHRRLGHTEAAAEALAEAVAVLAPIAATVYLADARLELGAVAAERGDAGLAREQLGYAVELYDSVGSPRREEAAAALVRLRSAGVDGDVGAADPQQP